MTPAASDAEEFGRQDVMTLRTTQSVYDLVEQLLSDPLTELVMNADGVDRRELQVLLVNACLAAAPVETLEYAGEPVVAASAGGDGYRLGVGVMLFNRSGQVLVGRRVDMETAAWQMPQGGVDAGETPREAALRELREEIGTDRVEILAEADDWLCYTLPSSLVGRVWGGRWCGQQQKWFAMLFLGEDQDIDVATEHPEFSEWKWVSLTELPALTVSFKRAVYQELTRRFSPVSPGTQPLL